MISTTIKKQYKTLRLILGDQLNQKHSWYSTVNDDILYVLMEVKQETNYVKHHIQKVVAFFLSMRFFAEQLTTSKHQVLYISLNDKSNQHDFTLNLKAIINEYKIENLEYQLPDEYRLDQQFNEFSKTLGINIKTVDTEHFYATRYELKDFFSGKKMYLMESFYRHMRKKHGVMMNGNEPITGKWNYDSENRNKLPDSFQVIDPINFDRDVAELVKVIKDENIETIGVIDEKAFVWSVTRKESLILLDFFLNNCLQYFGQFQDAMHTQHWSLYHSRLSFALNVKLISPREVVDAAVEFWKQHESLISIAQIEGFVRQIIGWREYMRGIYWAKMPDYESLNFFNYNRKLPNFFWNGETKMNCLKHAINQSLDYAYAHHIQRLMVTGNFSLLSGIHPDEVDNWYLGIYIDAIQWVEITNTRGMSQFADGGIVGTKPYVSSANYIAKMSNYCNGCYYDKTKKVGERACPFNSLYWNFYNTNRSLLQKNPRIGMMYITWDKMNAHDKEAILKQADYYLKNLESL
jgi:deoxyribodipyrimidine photolyase-related protein